MITAYVAIFFVLLLNITGAVFLSFKVRNLHVLISSVLFNLSVSAWQVCIIVTKQIIDNDLLHRLTFISASWVVVAYLAISFIFPTERFRGSKYWLMTAVTSLNFLFANLILFTNFVIKGYIKESEDVLFGSYGNYFLAFLFLTVIYATINFLIRYIRDKEGRFYFKYILAAFAITVAIGLMTNLLFPILGNTTLSIVGSVVAVLPQISIIYTLGFGNLLSLKSLYERLITLILKSALYFGLFYLALFINNLFPDSIHSMAAYTRGIFIAFSFAFFTTLVEIYGRRVIKRIFSQEDISNIQIRDIFNERLKESKGIEETTEVITNIINKYLNVSQSTIIFIDKRNLSTQNSKVNIKRFSKLPVDYLSWLLKKQKDGLLNLRLVKIGQYDFPRLRSLSCIQEAEIIQILRIDEGKRGYLILGKKHNLEPYTKQELDLLKDIQVLVGTALSKAFIFERLQKYSQELEKEVNKATKQLKEKIEIIEQARQKEREMLDIMGHELRTPLSIIRINFGVLEDTLKNKIDVKAVQKYILNIKESIDRQSKLINTFLNTTKLDKGHLELNLEKIKVGDLINNSYEGVKQEIVMKKLYFKITDPKGLLATDLVLDRIKFQEVLDNLVSNAVKYTEKGGVEIVTRKTRLSFFIDIIDTGRGISKEALEHIGEKFFREDSYLKTGRQLVRPGGTGLGIYVSKGIIKQHGGDLEIQSKKGYGSKFTIKIPSANKETKEIGENKVPHNMFERLRMKKS